jgi:hypothetical protein
MTDNPAVIVFPANNDTYRSRRRTLKACEACRKGRRKCRHEPGQTPAPRVLHSHVKAQESVEIGEPDASEQSEFIGDLNPVSILVKQPAEIGRDSQDCGIWTVKEASGIEGNGSKNVRNREAEAIVERDTSLSLSKTDQDVLFDIYLNTVQVVLPFFDTAWLKAQYANGTLHTILIRSINLIAGKDTRARPYLRFTSENALSTARRFCTILYKAITSQLQSARPRNRVELVQIYALLSMHQEGPNGPEEASLHFTIAVHHSQTISLQIERPAPDPYVEPLRNIFWSLYSLDKLNSCINARPLVMYDCDIGQRKYFLDQDCPVTPHVAWLRIADVLRATIDYYRPTVSNSVTGWEENFPNFEEDIFGQGTLENIAPEHIGMSLFTKLD